MGRFAISTTFMNTLFKGIDPYETGTHKFPFIAALRCLEAGLTELEAEKLIDAEEYEMPRLFKSGEVAEAVGSAYGSSAESTRPPKWPQVNRAKQRQVMADNSHVTIDTLRSCSPEPLDQSPGEILQKLFPGDPLVCISEEFNSGTHTMPLSDLTDPKRRWFTDKASFVVPSPMSARQGLTKAGKVSARSLDNTGPRQHVVVEIDDPSISKDQQAGILNHLAQFAPLVMVVDSGNKSIHGWYACHGVPEDTIAEFFKIAVELGADIAPWTRCQLVRMPNGIRRFDDERKAAKQSLIYLNPMNRNREVPVKGLYQ